MNFKWKREQQRLAGFKSNVQISFTFFQKIFYQDNAKMSEEHRVYSTVLFDMTCLDVNENIWELLRDKTIQKMSQSWEKLIHIQRPKKVEKGR